MFWPTPPVRERSMPGRVRSSSSRSGAWLRRMSSRVSTLTLARLWSIGVALRVAVTTTVGCSAARVLRRGRKREGSQQGCSESLDHGSKSSLLRTPAA